MELKGQEFVEAARSLGIGHMKILFRHIAPNLFGAVIVYTTLAVPGIMLLEAVLSFLGLGVKAPNSSWGTLIKEGADRMEVSPELLLFPALLFSATLLALNFLGDGLRDAPGSQVLQGLMFLNKNHEDCVNDFHAGGLQRFYDVGVVRPSEEGVRGGWQAPAGNYPDELGIGVF